MIKNQYSIKNVIFSVPEFKDKNHYKKVFFSQFLKSSSLIALKKFCVVTFLLIFHQLLLEIIFSYDSIKFLFEI